MITEYCKQNLTKDRWPLGARNEASSVWASQETGARLPLISSSPMLCLFQSKLLGRGHSAIDLVLDGLAVGQRCSIAHTILQKSATSYILFCQYVLEVWHKEDLFRIAWSPPVLGLLMKPLPSKASLSVFIPSYIIIHIILLYEVAAQGHKLEKECYTH